MDERKQMLKPTGSLVRSAWRLYSGRFRTFIGISVVPMTFLAIGSLIVRAAGDGRWVGGLVTLAGVIAAVLASVALVLTASKRSRDAREAYRHAMDLFWPAVWLGLLTEFVTIGGFVMLIVPGIIMGVWFTFAMFVFVLEGHRGLAALSKSREYVRGYWWPVFGRCFLFMLCLGIADVVIEAIVAGIAGPIAGTIAYDAVGALILPLEISFFFELYEDMRSVKPALAAEHSESKANRGFFITSGIVGIIAPIVFGILFVVFALPAIKQAALQQEMNYYNEYGSMPGVQSPPGGGAY